MKTSIKILLSFLLIVCIAGCSCASEKNTKIGLENDFNHSFKVTDKGLTENTYYVVLRDALSYDHIVAHDRQRLICSLQGLINRNTEKSHVALLIESVSENEKTWSEYMKNTGGVLEGMNEVVIKTWDEFLSTFKNQILDCGMVLWDPQVPATANVAATICGVKGYLPVKDIDGGVKAELTKMGVEVKKKLTGMFDGKGRIPDTRIDSTGSPKNDAYIWAMEKYMKKCSDRYIMCVTDGACTVEGNYVLENNFEAQRLFGTDNIACHDYGIARQMFFIDLSPISTETPCDDKDQALGTDLETLKKILDRRYKNSKGEYGCMVGAPPWQMKYTDYQGMGTVSSVTLEREFTKYLTQYNMFLDSDSYCINTSLYCQYKLDKDYKNGDKTVTEKYEENTVYVCYNMGGYDGTKTTVDKLLSEFNDEARGQIPLNWTINPGLADRIPMVFDYIYKNLSENDVVISANSGIGIIDAQQLYLPNPIVTNGRTKPSGDEKFISVGKPYFNKFDIDLMGFLDADINDDIMGTYNKIFTAGCFHSDYGVEMNVSADVAYIPTVSVIGCTENVTQNADILYSYWQSSGKNDFYPVQTMGWSPGRLTEATKAFETLIATEKPGYKVKVVSAYDFVDLIRQSKGITAK